MRESWVVVNNVRILVADDHDLVRSMLRQIISRVEEGWVVCGEAPDGETALAKAAELRPDLIILDFRMPVLDGLSAGKRIREVLPDVPILIHTVFFSEDLNVAAREAGMQAVVRKGDAQALVAEIRRILSPKTVAGDIAISAKGLKRSRTPLK